MDRLILAIAGLCACALASAADAAFVIQIKNGQFVPALLRIPASTKVRIVLDNTDGVAEEFDSHSLNREKHVPPRSKVTLFVGPLEPGRYVFEGEERGDSGGVALGVIEVR